MTHLHDKSVPLRFDIEIFDRHIRLVPVRLVNGSKRAFADNLHVCSFVHVGVGGILCVGADNDQNNVA